MEKASDQLWDSLYWTHNLTRPDRLAKVINTILRKNSTDTNHFLYDSQAVKNSHKLGLTQHDIDRVKQLDKLLATNAHKKKLMESRGGQSGGGGSLDVFGLFSIGGGGGSTNRFESQQFEEDQKVTDSTHNQEKANNHLNVTNIESKNDTQYTLTRNDVEKYLSELSDHVHLEGELIRPKPIDAHLIKLSTLRVGTKLLSHTALVRTRSNVHVLPLRCPPKENRKSNTTNLYRWLEDKVDQLTTTVERLTNRLSDNTTSQQHKELDDKVQQLTATVERLTNRLSDSTTSQQHKKFDDKVQQLTANVERLTNRLSDSTTSQQHKELDHKVQQLTVTAERLANELSECSRERNKLEKRIATLEEKVAEKTMTSE